MPRFSYALRAELVRAPRRRKTKRERAQGIVCYKQATPYGGYSTPPSGLKKPQFAGRLLLKTKILWLRFFSGHQIFQSMANTYSQIYIQVVFAVAARQCLIRKQNKEELHKYVTGIVNERGQKLLAVHSMPDHTHLLVGLRPSISLSDLVRDVKNAPSNFVNGKRWVLGRFSWQEGFGAFSYGHSQLTGIIR